MTGSPQEGIRPIGYVEYRDGTAEEISGVVIEERSVCLFVNGREVAALLCSPGDLEDLAVGFAFSEGLVDAMSEIEEVSVSKGGTCVDLWLTHEFDPPDRRVITSGCGGGVTFDDPATLAERYPPMSGGPTVTPSQVSRLMEEVLRSAALYRAARGVHTSALCDPDRPLLIAQDVGRHNTVDRLAGRALRTGFDPRGRILVTSGRVSSEMIAKAARLGAPLVISRTSPTTLSVELAAAWNLTVIGYARGTRFRVYAAPQRIDPGPG